MGGRSTWQLANKTAALTGMVMLDLILIPRWGIVGAATAWAVSIVLDAALARWQVRHLMGIQPVPGHLVHAVAQPLALVAVPALASRWMFGGSATAAAGTALVLSTIYLGCGWRSRRALGLTRLFALRAPELARQSRAA